MQLELYTSVIHILFSMVAGSIIGIALLGQFFVNISTVKSLRFKSTKKKLLPTLFRIVSAIISFVVLVVIIRLIKIYSILSILNVLAITVGLLLTVLFGLKKLKGKKNK